MRPRAFYPATDSFFDHGQIARGPEVHYSSVTSIVRKGSDWARCAALTLALVATSLLLLQPICAAAEHQDFSADSSCATLDVAPVAATAGEPSVVGERVALVPHPAHAAERRDAPYLLEPPSLVASSLPPLRYHARSARILR